MSKKKIYDFSGWATKNDLRCSDGRTIRRDAFKDDDGRTVPLVWMHQHDDPNNVLGHAVLENREEGVYAYCSFNDGYAGKQAKEIVRHGDVASLSIWANNLTQNGGDVLHGSIKEVSVVLAGANPGALIDFPILAHGEESTTEANIFTGEPIMVHSDEEEEVPAEKKEEPKSDKTVKEVIEGMSEEKQDVLAFLCGKALEEGAAHADEEGDDWMSHADDDGEEDDEGGEGPTVQEVLDSMTEEERAVTDFMVGQALEEGKNNPETATEEEVEHSEDEGEEETMKANVFDQSTENPRQNNVLTHADGIAILKMAQANGGMSLKAAISLYAEQNNKDVLAHAAGDNDLGFKSISTLFPDYQLINGPEPETLTTDQGWIGTVLRKVRKVPKSRLRVRFADARDISARRAQGYTKGTQKQFMGNIALLGRTVDPTTVYNLDHLDRDDMVDITDFSLVDYMYRDQERNLKEELARQIMIGDGRNGDTENGQPIDATKIIPIWGDDSLFVIHTLVDVAGMRTTMNGSNSTANFGDNYVTAEAVLQTLLYSREDYKGSGAPDFFCTPHLVNVMLLARDLNGRRIYDNVNDLRAALNVNELVTAEQFAGKTRTVVVNGVQQTRRLLGILVNLNDYDLGAVKGGEITHFTDFDIRFNQHESLLETRCSGMLTKVKSAIVLEEVVNPQ